MRRGRPTLGVLLVLAAVGLAVVNVGRIAAASGAVGVCLNSFPGGTPVAMADGSEVSIRDVRVGDKVLATDPVTGETSARPVTALIREHERRTMVDLGLSDGSSITATDLHPFWDASAGTFTHAIDLHLGDQLLTDDGRYLTVTSAHSHVRELKTYNLTIAGIHTYYAGTTPVLVHNASCFSFEGKAANYAHDELAWMAHEHTGAGADATRPTFDEITEAMKQQGERMRKYDGSRDTAVKFVNGKVTVIINETSPIDSSAWKK